MDRLSRNRPLDLFSDRRCVPKWTNFDFFYFRARGFQDDGEGTKLRPRNSWTRRSSSYDYDGNLLPEMNDDFPSWPTASLLALYIEDWGTCRVLVDSVSSPGVKYPLDQLFTACPYICLLDKNFLLNRSCSCVLYLYAWMLLNEGRRFRFS